MPRSNKDVLINNACAYFNTFSAMFEGCLASRIAYVSNDFSFDDNGEHMQSFIKEIKFIASTDNATELNIRYNTPVTISDEQFNCVTQISNVVIGNNNNPNIGKRKSIMISHDVNTLLANMSERFELNNLHDYFEKMVTLTHDKLESLEQID
jgi:hypothetical protein